MKIRALYEQILAEMRKARWQDVAIDPQAFVRDRLPREMIEQLQQKPCAIRIHCGKVDTKIQKTIQRIVAEARASGSALVEECTVRQLFFPKAVKADDESKPRVEEEKEAPKAQLAAASSSKSSEPAGREDFPLHIHVVEPGPEYHLVNLDSETWIKQLLYVLAVLGVDPAQIVDAPLECGQAKQAGSMIEHLLKKATELNLCKTIDSLTIGTKGLIPAAINRISLTTPGYRSELARVKFENALTCIKQKLGVAFDAAVFKRDACDFAAATLTVLNRFRQLDAPWPRVDDQPVPEATATPEEVKTALQELSSQAKPGTYLYGIKGKLSCKTRKDFNTLLGYTANIAAWEEQAEALEELAEDTQSVAKLKDIKLLIQTPLRHGIIAADTQLKMSDVIERQKRLMAILAVATSTDGKKTVQWEECVRLALADDDIVADPNVKYHLENLSENAQAKLQPTFHSIKRQPAFQGEQDVNSDMYFNIQGKCHLLMSVTDAHGELSYHLVKAALAQNPALRINFFGTCGSLSYQAFPVTTFVRPVGAVINMEPGIEPLPMKIDCPNKVAHDLFRPARHFNVCTLLQEHDGKLADWRDHFDTMDMEVYHICRAIQEAPEAELRVILRVSDAVDSKEHGAQSDSLLVLRTPEFDGHMDQVVAAFGLIDPAYTGAGL